MSQRSASLDSRIDYSLILPVFFLILIGLLAIYVATSHDFPDRLLMTMLQQLVWIGIGVATAFVVMLFSTSFLWKVTPWLYVLGLGLMVLPLIFYSPSLVAATGAKNWISIGSMTLFQPSEFMKISYILALARGTVWFQNRVDQPDLKDDLKLGLLYAFLTIPVMIFLALQKDLGTALVFLAILVGMLIISGISWKLLAPAFGLVVLGISLFLFIFLTENGKEWFYQLGVDTYQLNRISAWLDPFDYADTIAYQQTQGMIAIGTGGLLGKGLNVLDLAVPVRESDMIFTVIAENFGFIGSSILLFLYLLLIYRMLRVTLASNNLFYTYISTGFIMMILFHIFENMGAALGILPLTGIPLPFISQGGSSLVSNLIGVGLILSMSYQNDLARQREIDHYFSRRKK